MSCPNCPGPRVPHHCGKLPTLVEQMAALASSWKSRRRGGSMRGRLVAPRVPAHSQAGPVAAPRAQSSVLPVGESSSPTVRQPLPLPATSAPTAMVEDTPTIKNLPEGESSTAAVDASGQVPCAVAPVDVTDAMSAACTESTEDAHASLSNSSCTVQLEELVDAIVGSREAAPETTDGGNPAPSPRPGSQPVAANQALGAPLRVARPPAPPQFTLLPAGICPNCPGPGVPHRCGMVPTLRDQLKACRTSCRRPPLLLRPRIQSTPTGPGVAVPLSLGAAKEPTTLASIAPALPEAVAVAPAVCTESSPSAARPTSGASPTASAREPGVATAPAAPAAADRPAPSATEMSSAATFQSCQTPVPQPARVAAPLECAAPPGDTEAASLEASASGAGQAEYDVACSQQVCSATPASAPSVAALCKACGMRPPAAASCQRCAGRGFLECSRCSGTGRFKPACRACNGSGTFRGRLACRACSGKGSVDRGECNGCRGAKGRQCFACQGAGVPVCSDCAAKQEEQRMQVASAREQGPPPPGVSISPCAAGELSSLADLWSERGGRGRLVEAWIVDNPLLTYNYHERRRQLKNELGREPDELQGFHGTHPDNVLSISQTGFDSSRRAGQVYGAGEYFAKNPTVSQSYCRGGEYMFVCRLCLGHRSSDESNLDGDHIWVPSTQYYVISQPDQILPQYIVKFSGGCMYGGVSSSELSRVLSMPRWSTKRERQVMHVPQNRPCAMSMQSTNALWMGYLHAYLEDSELERDVCGFFARHAPDFTSGMRVHIASGKYKKAHVQMAKAMPRDLVHRLNRLPFVEGGKERRICVDDAHGSPGQQCPRWIAGYCRGRNLRYTHSCWCSHKARPTEGARYKLLKVSLDGAKGTEVVDRFLQSAPFHDGSRPRVVEVHAVQNDVLAGLHEEYRQYLRNKNKEEPTMREFYHGTNNNILPVLFTHGLQPPSDFRASDDCPVSGGKGLCTSLCNNDCKHCVERHEWDRCHMFGLGIYLADLSQKSHRYCSHPEVLPNGRRRFRMVLCSVLGRALEVAGHLKSGSAMHDVPNVRALGSDLAEMIEPHRCCLPDKEAVEQADILAIKGLGCHCRPGFSVVNSEYIAYHPYQCLPKYQITYDV
mmetsp:Transcript_50943/g.162995  ORF Transcript_50943/g.162995 Transcript_50943/m.162995 type:complete len:1120 (+) Transcript_50943:53-3412(+)